MRNLPTKNIDFSLEKKTTEKQTYFALLLEVTKVVST